MWNVVEQRGGGGCMVSGQFELGVNLSESERGANTDLCHLAWLRPLQHL